MENSELEILKIKYESLLQQAKALAEAMNGCGVYGCGGPYLYDLIILCKDCRKKALEQWQKYLKEME